MKETINSIEAVKIIRLRYITAITIIAILVISSHAIMEFTNKKAEFDSRIINIAGRQRMLSQKITKCVFGLYISKDKKENEKYLEELTNALDLWKKSHYGLVQGDSTLGLPGKNSSVVSELFNSIDLNFATIVLNATEVIELSLKPNFSKELIFSKLETIRKNELIFLPTMDKIVFQYDSEAKEKVNQNKSINMLLGLITLLTLALEAMFIFKPLEKEVADTIDKLTVNEENLRNLFDVAPQPLFLVLPKTYEILRLNQKASETVGLDFDIALGKNVTDFLDKKIIERIDVVDHHKFNGHLDNIETVLINSKGQKYYMLMSVSRLFYHQQNIFLLGLTDISKQKEQEKELSHFATIDEMTGLINRRAGLIFLEKEFDSAKRGQLELSLAFIDIDNLKKTNDTYGHEQGDELIKTISSIIQKNIRQGDIALRYGGDEIVVVLKYCKLDLAQIILERIHLDLDILNKSKSTVFKHEISYGIVEYDKFKYSHETDLLDAADKLMYENKMKKKEKYNSSIQNS